ncbi:MAG: hypothetical protein JWQ40_2400 [Segetibacter sp.]|jgi:hypothetical protein|nr:hypothetical protein [Segetibacter sp.]
MKNFIIVLCMLSLSFSAFAQSEDEEKSHKFRRDNIFLGGSFGLGMGGGGFSAGVNPEAGYTIAQWLDAGISTNFNYNSFSAEYNGGVRQRSFNKGAGLFVRAFPFRGFFVQVLPEYNIITTNLKDVYNTGEEVRIKQEAPSLLLGVGYGSRMVGNMNYFTVLMFDAGTNTNSPYIGYSGSKLPIMRAGFNFYLRPKRRE